MIDENQKEIYTQEIRRSGLFDEKWYQKRYRKMVGKKDPLDHYISYGTQIHLKPNVFFDPQWYAITHSIDLKGIDILLHYINTGSSDNMDPSPLFQNRKPIEKNVSNKEEITPLTLQQSVSHFSNLQSYRPLHEKTPQVAIYTSIFNDYDTPPPKNNKP